ncbi:calcium/sodium antiporter [Antarctobacter sp.]|uniref:calcium/sodium antiporter n=1 Tax=Antarctobacter sp. TaxID=1872577 RepID=UPI002B279098|nr:calcium/sodium antiporter [Antarctobacter sp.]
MDLLFVLGGLVALVVGGDVLVRGAVSVARSLRVPPMVIGLTLVGFGTSAPELVTSLQAALTGSPGLAVGNVVGSNIGNVLLILGIAALIAPIAVDTRALRRDGAVLAGATLLGLWAMAQGVIPRPTGALFVAAILAYVGTTLLLERRRASDTGALYTAEADLLPMHPTRLGRDALLTIGGLVLTVLGARFLVEGAVGIASAMGISETIIGLTVVAIGTSMPELVTSVMAVRRGEGAVALGNVIGSNIFNILGILGITALVVPIDVPAQILSVDGWVMAAATVALLVFATSGARVSRREAGALLASYGAYMGWLFMAA